MGANVARKGLRAPVNITLGNYPEMQSPLRSLSFGCGAGIKRGTDHCAMLCASGPIDAHPMKADGGKVWICAGNISTTSFKEMWDTSAVFSQLRNLDVDTCVTCFRFEVFRGGCPAICYHTYRDIHMPDPECLINLKLNPEDKTGHAQSSL